MTVGTLPRSVLADQVKERLLEEILSGRYRAGRADRRDAGRARAGHQPGARSGRRSAASRRSASSRSRRSAAPASGGRPAASCSRPTSSGRRSRSWARGSRSRASTPTAIDELAGHVAEMEAAARAGDGRTVAEADARFHGRIVELADNGSLAKLWRSLEPFSRTYLTLDRARRRPRVVGRAPRADPRGAPGARRRRPPSTRSGATSPRSARTWPSGCRPDDGEDR